MAKKNKKNKFKCGELLDWKCNGAEIAWNLQNSFSEIIALHAEEFSEIAQEYSNEAPSESLMAYGDYFGQLGYALFNVDSGADDYHLSLCLIEQIEAFTAYWRIQGLSVERYGRSKSATPKHSSPSSKKKRKLPSGLIVEDGFSHHNYGGLDLSNSDLCTVELSQPTKKSGEFIEKHWLVDCGQWPPLKMQETFSQGLIVYSICQSKLGKIVAGIYNSRQPQSETVELYTINPRVEFSAWTPWTTFNEELPKDIMEMKFIDEQLWIVSQQEKNNVIYFGHEQILKAVFTEKKRNNVLYVPIGGRRFLHLLDWRKVRVFDSGILLDEFNLRIPVGAFEQKPFVVGDDLIYFSTSKRRSDNTESYEILRIVKFNMKSQLTRTLELEEFGGARGFDGFLEVCNGPQGWMILNYISGAYGKKDVAWLWHIASSEFYRIPQSAFEHEAPQLYYSCAQDRYLASASAWLMRLVETNALLSHLQEYSLRLDKHQEWIQL